MGCCLELRLQTSQMAHTEKDHPMGRIFLISPFKFRCVQHGLGLAMVILGKTALNSVDLEN